MKKYLWGVFFGSFFMLIVLRLGVMKNPFGESTLLSPVAVNLSDPLQLINPEAPPAFRSPESAGPLISTATLLSSLFIDRNFSHEVESSLLTWNRMGHLVNYSQGLPNAIEAIREAQVAWESLMESFNRGKQGDLNESSLHEVKGKQCPYFLNKMNATEFGSDGYKLRLPCGLIQGSAITIIGIPNGLLGSFRIDLSGEQLPGEPEPPIILHYNVRLLGDKITEDPVIVQNTWTAAQEWGEEERCPPSVPGENRKGTDTCLIFFGPPYYCEAQNIQHTQVFEEKFSAGNINKRCTWN